MTTEKATFLIVLLLESMKPYSVQLKVIQPTNQAYTGIVPK